MAEKDLSVCKKLIREAPNFLMFKTDREEHFLHFGINSFFRFQWKFFFSDVETVPLKHSLYIGILLHTLRGTGCRFEIITENSNCYIFFTFYKFFLLYTTGLTCLALNIVQ